MVPRPYMYTTTKHRRVRVHVFHLVEPFHYTALHYLMQSQMHVIIKILHVMVCISMSKKSIALFGQCDRTLD